MKETLYIMSNDYKISKSLESVKYTHVETNNHIEVPACRLDAIEIYGNIVITNPLFKLCNKYNIPIFFNTYNGFPLGKYLPASYKSHILQIHQIKTYLNKNKKTEIAKEIVIKAIEGRLKIIQKYDKYKKCEKECILIKKFQKKASECQTCTRLRGIEGNYMKQYFSAFRKLLQNLPFHNRTTQPPKDAGNAILSWGNVLLYNTVNSEIYKTGVDTKIGFLHEPQENRDSLSIDVAEIFRPIIVDNLILQLDRKHHLSEKRHFRNIDEKCLLSNVGKTIWIDNYRNILKKSLEYHPLGRKISIKEEIKLEMYNMIKYWNGEKDHYKPLHFKNT